MEIKKLFFIVIFILILIILSLFVISKFNIDKVMVTRITLTRIRIEINTYKEKEKEYPPSLFMLYRYLSETLDSNEEMEVPRERITNANNVVASLDGNGGWYYDSKTGEVRVNLTVPLKEYFLFYFKKDKNEIPAEW